MTQRPSLRLILMSATIATDKFASYLGLALSKERGTKKVMMLNYQPQVDSIQGQWEDTADLILASLSSPTSSSSSHTTKHTSKIATSNLSGNQTVPVLFIPGFTYPVTEYYKNEFENIVQSYITNLKRSNISSGGSGGRGGDSNNIDDDSGGGGWCRGSGGGGGGSSQSKHGDINYELMSNLILTLAIGTTDTTPSTTATTTSTNSNMLQRATGCILVFMPGTLEISKLIQRIQSDYQTIVSNHTSQLNPSKSGFGQVDLKDTPDTNSNYNTSQLNSDRLIDIPRIKLLPLHGQLSQSEQKAVFDLSDRELKIVVSTNVAEV